MRELEASRKPDYARSEERIGITKDVWFLAAAPAGDALVGYMETGDFTNALALFSRSQDEFDMWFKRRMADCTGVDLNDPPAMSLPELLSSYRAEEALPQRGDRPPRRRALCRRATNRQHGRTQSVRCAHACNAPTPPYRRRRGCALLEAARSSTSARGRATGFRALR
jgi:hypothetical protein